MNGETPLASIVRRDGEWDAEFTNADWRAADLLRDRRALLALLRETRDALQVAEVALREVRRVPFDGPAASHWWDNARKSGLEYVGNALRETAALDPEPVR